GNVSAGFGIARALVTVGATCWTFFLLRSRVLPSAAIAISIVIALLAGAPFALTSSPFVQSMAMFYNRFGYVLILIIILESFQPSRAAFSGGVSTGCAMGLLLFLKISFFGVALGIVALSFLVSPARLRRGSGLVLGFLAIVLPFMIWLRFDIAAIIRDFRIGALAKSANFPAQRLIRTLNNSLLGILLTFSLGAITVSITWNKKTNFLENLRPLALTLMAIVAEVVIDISNQQDAVFILMGVCCLVLLASIASVQFRPDWEAQTLLGAVLILGLCVPLPGCLYDAVGTGWTLLHNARHHGAPNLPRLDAPG